MNVTTHSIHFDADKDLLDFIEKKVQKLQTLYEPIIDAEVFLKAEKTSIADNKTVEIKLNVPGKDLFAKKNASSFEHATDLTVDALKHQIEKKKSK